MIERIIIICILLITLIILLVVKQIKSDFLYKFVASIIRIL